jgi:hypothetical protein
MTEQLAAAGLREEATEAVSRTECDYRRLRLLKQKPTNCHYANRTARSTCMMVTVVESLKTLT